MPWPSEDFCELADELHERRRAQVVRYVMVSVRTWESVDMGELANQVYKAIIESGTVRLGNTIKVLPITAWTV